MRLPLPLSTRLVITSTAAALLCTLPLLRAFAVAPARRLSPSFLLASTRPFASIPSPIMAATAASAANNGGLGDIGQAPSSSSSASTSQPREEKEESGERKPQWVLDLGRSTRNNRDSHSRYIQLATVGSHPNDATVFKPFVRTVVFRGFYNGADAQDKVRGNKCFGRVSIDDVRPPYLSKTSIRKSHSNFFLPRSPYPAPGQNDHRFPQRENGASRLLPPR